MVAETYRGYTNYETWTVKLWIDNDEGAYRFWKERATEVGVSRLGEELHASLQGDNPVRESGVYADLMKHAFKRVNFQEIARKIRQEANTQPEK